jgi:hypothetical protein
MNLHRLEDHDRIRSRVLTLLLERMRLLLILSATEAGSLRSPSYGQRGTERMRFNMCPSRAVGRYLMKGRGEIDNCKRDSKMLAW